MSCRCLFEYVVNNNNNSQCSAAAAVNREQQPSAEPAEVSVSEKSVSYYDVRYTVPAVLHKTCM